MSTTHTHPAASPLTQAIEDTFGVDSTTELYSMVATHIEHHADHDLAAAAEGLKSQLDDYRAHPSSLVPAEMTVLLATYNGYLARHPKGQAPTRPYHAR